jgi:hypothetical protein
MEQPSQELLLSLVASVRAGLLQRGFHFLSRDEIDQLCGESSDASTRLRCLNLFAGSCSVDFETNRDVTAARLTDPSMAAEVEACASPDGSREMAHQAS